MKDCLEESTGSIQRWQHSSVKLTAEYDLTPNNAFHSKRADTKCASFHPYALLQLYYLTMISPDM